MLCVAKYHHTTGEMVSEDLGNATNVAAELSFDSVMITDRGGSIVYVNEAFETLTGHRRDDVIGLSAKFLQGPATDGEVIARLADDLANGRVFEGRAINYKKDGSPFVMHWKVAPVKGSDGSTITHFVAVQRVLSQ